MKRETAICIYVCQQRRDMPLCVFFLLSFTMGGSIFFSLVSSAVVAVAYGRSIITDFLIQRTLASLFGCSLSRKTAIMLLRGASIPIVEFVLK